LSGEILHPLFFLYLVPQLIPSYFSVRSCPQLNCCLSPQISCFFLTRGVSLALPSKCLHPTELQ
jgi:hypothetical protein